MRFIRRWNISAKSWRATPSASETTLEPFLVRGTFAHLLLAASVETSPVRALERNDLGGSVCEKHYKLPVASDTKPVTIDTQGFTLSGTDCTDNPPGSGGNIRIPLAPTTTLTISGTLAGGNTVSTSSGGAGLLVTGPVAASAVNNGSITGGNNDLRDHRPEG
jgi:hypothetical protein